LDPGAKTYLACVDLLFEEELHALMIQRGGWRAVTLAEALQRKVDLVVVEGRWCTDDRLYGVRSALKGRLKVAQLNNKVALHELLQATHPEYLTESIVCHVGRGASQVRFAGGVWIWRPHLAFGGKGVVMVTNQGDLDRAMAQKLPGKKALLSRYILDPLLAADGCKFHIRLNLLLVVGPLGKRAAVFKNGDIIRASQAYEPRDFGNRKIHDTHGKHNLPQVFPDHYPGGHVNAVEFFPKACRMLGDVCTLAFPTVSWYEENDAGFEVLGVDLMVLAGDENPVILEINSRPGLNQAHGTHAWTLRRSRETYTGMLAFLLDDPPVGYEDEFLVEVARA
jgi:hypothetical protein